MNSGDQETAATMRLRRSDPSSPGIRRRRYGAGFRYLAPDGSPIRDPETLERIRGLVIPPAWREVWVCPQPNGHIQAVGLDDADRRQYLYHPRWRRARDEEKYERVLQLAGRLPSVRATIAEDIARRRCDRLRVLAIALRLLDQGVFRTGGEEYVEAHGSRGATTLLREHVRIRGDELTFRYPGKSGVEQRVTFTDPELAPALNSLRRCRTGTPRLLVCRDDTGWCELRSEDVNERFKQLAGDEFTVKDLRTWHATVLAAIALADAGPVTSQRARKRAEAAAMREVADELGNTAAVARRSYVDPRVLRAYESGTTLRPELCNGSTVREEAERAVARLLRAAGG